MRQIVGLVLLVFCLLVSQSYVALATCTGIAQPTAAYTMGTEICSIGTIGGTSSDCKDSDNNLEAKFSVPLTVRHVPDGWLTWSAPPNSETDTPIVGWTTGSTLTITLADGYLTGTAGTEIEPNNFGSYNVSVQFRDLAGSTVATLSQPVVGDHGARLFAVTCDEELINKIVINVDPAAAGFAVAKVRADSYVINRDPLAGPTQGSYPIPKGAKSNANVPD